MRGCTSCDGARDVGGVGSIGMNGLLSSCGGTQAQAAEAKRLKMVEQLEEQRLARQRKAQEAAARSQQEREERQQQRQRLKEEWKSKKTREGVPLFMQLEQKFHVRPSCPGPSLHALSTATDALNPSYGGNAIPGAGGTQHAAEQSLQQSSKAYG
jgi:hypothetical protein